jgi:hypothetical protein
MFAVVAATTNTSFRYQPTILDGHGCYVKGLSDTSYVRQTRPHVLIQSTGIARISRLRRAGRKDRGQFF